MKNFRSIAALLAACLPFVAAAQYHDAELFEAKGPVQKISVKYTRPGATFLDFYSFSSTGELTETKFGPVLQIERDAQGRISKYVYDTFDSSYYNIEYDDKGRVASQGTIREATEFHYGSNGQISEAHYIDCAYEITTNVEKYEYLAFDDRGNWTERKIYKEEGEICTEKRTITYWPETSEKHAGGSAAIGTAADATDTPSQAQAEASEHKEGFLHEAFSKLAEGGGAKRQEEARALRERSLQRRAEAETALAATELTALSMIDHPLGVLSAPVTYDEAAALLSEREGWEPDLSEPVWIAMSASRGYQLAYNNFIPRASASFSEKGEHRLESYDYLFSYIRGINFPEEVPLALIHKKATDMAKKIVADWEAAGIVVREDPSADPSQFEYAICADDGTRTIQIRISGKDRYVVNEYYTVYVNVEVR